MNSKIRKVLNQYIRNNYIYNIHGIPCIIFDYIYFPITSEFTIAPINIYIKTDLGLDVSSDDGVMEEFLLPKEKYMDLLYDSIKDMLVNEGVIDDHKMKYGSYTPYIIDSGDVEVYEFYLTDVAERITSRSVSLSIKALFNIEDLIGMEI